MNKSLLISLVSGVLVSCGGQLKMPSVMKMKHHYDKAYQQQEKLLGAKEVSLFVHRTQVTVGSAINQLDLIVLIYKNLAHKPNGVLKRARKLAHLVVADLANPQDYQAMTVTLAEHHDYLVAQNSNARTITYSIADLK